MKSEKKRTETPKTEEQLSPEKQAEARKREGKTFQQRGTEKKG